MASLELRGEKHRVVFYFGGKKQSVSLGVEDADAADAICTRIERRLKMLELGDATVPAGADLHTWLVSDGKLEQPVVASTGPGTVHALFEAYFAALPSGSNEANTLDSMRIHQRHLERLLPKQCKITALDTDTLQKYVNDRAEEAGMHGKVTPITIKKAIVTLRTIWNWGRDRGLTVGVFPGRKLKYPKGKEKPPFMTYAEIQRATKGLIKADAAELWEALFLTVTEIDQLLKHVQQTATQPFLYPLVAFCAFSGARRSEALRASITDIDFHGGIITVREKKRNHDQVTTRRVPIHPKLAKILKAWLKIHPGGRELFVQSEVIRSKTKREGPTPITRDEVHDHFKRAIAGSKWEVIRGYHTLRHSFISNAAAAGVDERMLDQWSGHTTDIRKRYLHLLPNKQKSAIRSVFGK